MDCLICSTLGVQPPGEARMGAEEEPESGTVLLDLSSSLPYTNFLILILFPPLEERKGTAKSLLEEVSKHGCNHSILKIAFLKQ